MYTLKITYMYAYLFFIYNIYIFKLCYTFKRQICKDQLTLISRLDLLEWTFLLAWLA